MGHEAPRAGTHPVVPALRPERERNAGPHRKPPGARTPAQGGLAAPRLRAVPRGLRARPRHITRRGSVPWPCRLFSPPAPPAAAAPPGPPLRRGRAWPAFPGLRPGPAAPPSLGPGLPLRSARAARGVRPSLRSGRGPAPRAGIPGPPLPCPGPAGGRPGVGPCGPPGGAPGPGAERPLRAALIAPRPGLKRERW